MDCMAFTDCPLSHIVDDFKPASVDTTQKSIVEIGQGNSVTVSVPHVEVRHSTLSMQDFLPVHSHCRSYSKVKILLHRSLMPSLNFRSVLHQ